MEKNLGEVKTIGEMVVIYKVGNHDAIRYE